MAHWRTRGFVQDSEDSEDEDEGGEDDNRTHNNPTIKALGDALCPPADQEGEQEQERMFFRIDEFTDRSSPPRKSQQCTAFPKQAPGQGTALAITNPVEGSLRSDMLSRSEKIWPSHGQESELRQQPAPDCSAGRGNPTTNLWANPGLLSLLRSSPPPDHEDHAEISAPLQPPSSVVLEVSEQHHTAPSVGEQAETPSSIGRMTRSLRKRNPIQLHPYLLEGERYRQSLKARGLKPLRINGGVQPQRNTSRSPTAHESDVEPWQDTQPQARTGGSRTLPSSPATPAGSSEDAFASSPALLRSSQEQFPGVDVLLHTDATNFVREGFKRRKVPSRRLQSPQATHTGASQPLRPLSGRTTTLRHRSPAIQSEQFAADLPISPPTTSSRELSMDDCSVDASHDPSHVRSPDTPNDATSGHARLPPQIFELSDDSESDTGPLCWQLPYSSTNRHRHTRPSIEGDPSRWWAHAEDADEVEEDNRIDAMLPPRARRRTILRRRQDHQRQQRVTESIGIGIDSPHERGSTTVARQGGRPIVKRPPIQSRRKANAAPRPKPTPRTRLGIIDAVKDDPPGQRAPNFIRLAHRRARARRDRGRHSPTKKQFQLATREETEEVQTILEDWAGGRLSPAAESTGASSGAVTDRRPLANVSTNIQSSPETERESRPTSTPPPRGNPTPQLSARKPASGRARPRAGASKVNAQPRNPQSPTRTLKIRSRPTSFLSPWEAMASAVRPAQLESTVTRYRDRTQQSRPGFQLQLAEIDRQYQLRILEDPKTAKVQLSRFLSSGQAQSPSRARDGREREFRAAAEDGFPRPMSPHRPALRRKPRKRTPQRLDIRAKEFQQPPVEALAPAIDATIDSPNREKQAVVLKGLSPFGTIYPISFGMVPLQLGTYFHESTFIGSGVFAKAVRADYPLKHARGEGQTSLTVGSTHYRWGAWNETVSTELGQLVLWASDVIIQARANDEGALSATKIEQLPSTLWGLSRYFSDSLLFLDGVDRRLFVQRCCHLLLELLEAVGSLRRPSSTESQQPSKPGAQISTVLLVLSYQVYGIAQSDVEPSNMTTVEGLVRSAALQLLSRMGPSQLDHVRSFHLGNRRQTTREAGVRDEFFLVETIVAARHILARLNIPGLSFWTLVNTESGWTTAESGTDVAVFERLWKDLFTLLPLHEFDEDGVLRVGRRFQVAEENWSLVRKMVSRVFKIYRSHPESQSPRFNSYCRALFARCHHLLVDWGWHKCENIIGTLFDFLALNELGHLRHEESNGSAQFLENLDRSPDLRIEARDRCFHIFLKITASGIKRLRQTYAESKIRNIVFRLMPNHGRQYPKGQLVRPEELDSLRNHHDLLCTLYWASPPPCRPSISIIRDLVDAETSHADACRVNIRAWLNLVRFQLSTDEPVTALTVLSSWHGTLISKLLTQYGLVRIEAEATHAATHTGGSGTLASELFKPSARTNRQALEGVISYAISSLTSAIKWSRYAETSITLLEKHSTVAVFSLFELRKRGADRLVVQSLQVVKEFARKSMELSKVQASQRSSEESQEYGDWSAIMEAAAMSPLKDAAEQLEKVVSEGLARLLSNAFGADDPPEDSVLQETVDTWALACQLLADASLKQWDDFIGEYSRHSWTTLRNTEQTRKYTAYFMAKVVDADAANYQTQRLLFLTHWVTSLVERESMLKFQHTFTNAMLNADPSEPLLKNLPFTFRVRDGAYSITLREFSERRLSLISSVLTNMREAVEEFCGSPDNDGIARREEYARLLKRLMTAMKSNYQELQQGNAVSGAYVEFVQAVVGFLQQYTVDICPVDRFFTDSAAFPLPARDPSYVVGRLKNYGLKLSAPPVHKQLASFVQTVSMRAAVDDQQAHLIVQLGDAMVSAFEDGSQERPTLRSFLLLAVFPAYIEQAFTTAAGWLLARPVLEASARAFDELLPSLDATNNDSLASVVRIMDHFLDVCQRVVEPLFEDFQLLQQPHILHVLGLVVLTLTATLVPLDYIHRSSGKAVHARRCAAHLDSRLAILAYVVRLGDSLVSVDMSSEALPAAPRLDPSSHEQPFTNLRRLCRQELHEALTKNWSRRDGTYYFVQGNTRKKVSVGGRPVTTLDQERNAVSLAIDRFHALFRSLPGLPPLLDVHDDGIDELDDDGHDEHHDDGYSVARAARRRKMTSRARVRAQARARSKRTVEAWADSFLAC